MQDFLKYIQLNLGTIASTFPVSICLPMVLVGKTIKARFELDIHDKPSLQLLSLAVKYQNRFLWNSPQHLINIVSERVKIFLFQLKNNIGNNPTL